MTYDIKGEDGEGRDFTATATKRPGCVRGCFTLILIVMAIALVLGALSATWHMIWTLLT
jgi:hypothetical protein